MSFHVTSHCRWYYLIVYVLSYRIVSYYSVWYHIIANGIKLFMSYDILRYHFSLHISYSVVSYDISLCIIWFHFISFHIISYHIISFMLYHMISCCIIVLKHVISNIFSCYFILKYILVYHFILYQIISYHISVNYPASVQNKMNHLFSVRLQARLIDHAIIYFLKSHIILCFILLRVCFSNVMWYCIILHHLKLKSMIWYFICSVSCFFMFMVYY